MQSLSPVPALRDAHAFLGREEVNVSGSEGHDAYSDRVVLVSGAGGSIGSELCRQIMACRPRKIVLYELSEPALYQIYQTLLRMMPRSGTKVIPVLGSVTDKAHMRRTLQGHRVQVVLHAAAYKHVPLVEANPLAGLSNNVLGTDAIVAESLTAGVQRFVLISSDKAVRPANIMGASKRLSELVVQNAAQRHAMTDGPIFSIVRFGNVLGSSGSVVPLFQEQLRRGGPLTVTHRDVCRYFMTVREAVHLVLRAGSMAEGGKVFVLDMGQPRKILNLARQIINSAGLSVRDRDNPSGDIEIKFTGLRPGDKMSEELTLDSALAPTAHPKIFAAREAGLSEIEVASALRTLRQAVADNDEVGARAVAYRWVEAPNVDAWQAGGAECR